MFRFSEFIVEGGYNVPTASLDKEKVDLDSIFIDVGASSKEEVLEMGINVGTVATFQAQFMKLGSNYYTGRALDNRIGGFMIAEVARLLKEKKDKIYIAPL